jgi:DNA modification methylase
MIKDIMDQNETVQPNGRIMSKLHADFPQCFNKEGQFDMEKFQQLVQTEVDVTHEGYELNFLGKNYANLIASTETETVIQPDLEHNAKPENCNSQNVYISGDNLDALKHLLKSYSNSVKCIYIDPPYNTGSDGFVYNDKFTFTKEQIQTKLGVNEEKAKRILDLTRRGSASHSAWLMFMAPRLMLAKDLLTDDGVIFISIDDNEQANLKLLCDSVFGEENHLGEFIWRKKDGGGQAKEAFIIEHEYIIVYSKSLERNWIEIVEKRDVSEYNKSDEIGKFKVTKLAKWGNTAHREERPTMYFPLIAPDGSEVYPIAPDGLDGRWRVGRTTMQDLLDNNLVYWAKKGGEWIPYEKEYFSDQDKIIKERSIMYEVANTGDGSDLLTELFGIKDTFENPKPIEIIKLFLTHTIEEGDIFLDFFSGSGTSAHALYEFEAEKKVKCSYIQVQLKEDCKTGKPAFNLGYKTIDEFGQERIRRAASKIKAEHPDYQGDLGFKHYTLQDVPQNTLDKMETFDPTGMFGDGNILEEYGKDTVLETWCVKDGYGFGANVSELKLADYTAYHCGSHLYFVEGNGFDENAMIALIDKYHSDPSFNPQNIVLFGYSFSFIQVEMLRKNLATLSDSAKNLNMNLDIRY